MRLNIADPDRHSSGLRRVRYESPHLVIYSQRLVQRSDGPAEAPTISLQTTMIVTPWSILALCPYVAPAFSQSNGMETSMDMPMDLAVGHMLPYLHFTPGDTGERT